MNLSDVLKASGVRCDLKADSMAAAIDELADLLVAAGKLPDGDAVRAALHQREAMGATAVGRGVAIPHAKCEGADRFVVAMGVHRDGLDADSPDKQPVQFLIAMVGPPANPEEHLRMLSHISRLFRSESLRDSLLRAGSDAAAYDLLIEAERQVSTGDVTRSELQKRKMILFVLHDEDRLDDVMELFLDMGMVGGVTLDTTSLEQSVTRRVPLFVDFAGFLDSSGYSKTIIGMVQEGLVDRISAELEELLGPLDNGGGFLAVLDVTLPRPPK